MLGQQGPQDVRLPPRWTRFWWRHRKHEHVPFHPGQRTLWYCGRCELALNWELNVTSPRIKYRRRNPR